jgi:hypothetical protein
MSFRETDGSAVAIVCVEAAIRKSARLAGFQLSQASFQVAGSIGADPVVESGLDWNRGGGAGGSPPTHPLNHVAESKRRE